VPLICLPALSPDESIRAPRILERLNRTFKHEFVFRHEVNTLADLQVLLPAFQHGYNQQPFRVSSVRRRFGRGGRYTLSFLG
jgi:hypothetical protein